MTTSTPMRHVGLSWLRLMGAAAVIELVLLVGAGAALRDSETLAFAVVVAAMTAWFFWRPSRVPVITRSLVFLDVLFFMATATVANLTTHESLAAIVLPLALAVTSASGLVATAGYLVGGGDARAEKKAASVVAIAALVLFATGLGVATTSRSDPQLARSGDVKLSAHGPKFSATALTASSGQVTIYVSNDDLFWHTLTLSQLGVDVRVPVKGHRRVTFAAAPGTYEFHCAIPGHESAGMKGTLTVH